MSFGFPFRTPHKGATTNLKIQSIWPNSLIGRISIYRISIGRILKGQMDEGQVGLLITRSRLGPLSPCPFARPPDVIITFIIEENLNPPIKFYYFFYQRGLYNFYQKIPFDKKKKMFGDMNNLNKIKLYYLKYNN